MNPTVDYTLVSMPTATWDLLQQTLQVDSVSHSFDSDLRAQITEALSQVQDVTDDLQTLIRRGIEMLPRFIADPGGPGELLLRLRVALGAVEALANLRCPQCGRQLKELTEAKPDCPVCLQAQAGLARLGKEMTDVRGH